jgi:hypothetical protein
LCGICLPWPPIKHLGQPRVAIFPSTPQKPSRSRFLSRFGSAVLRSEPLPLRVPFACSRLELRAQESSLLSPRSADMFLLLRGAPGCKDEASPVSSWRRAWWLAAPEPREEISRPEWSLGDISAVGSIADGRD